MDRDIVVRARAGDRDAFSMLATASIVRLNAVVGQQFDFYTMRPDGTDVFQVTNEPEDNYFADWGTYPLDR